MAESVAVYAGSFDPCTLGHLDIVRRGSGLFERVVVAVGSNPAKRYLFPTEVRMDVLRAATSGLPNVDVARFNDLLVNFCHRIGARVIIRGLRAVADFEFEFQIGLANRDMDPDLETVFLLPAPRFIFISSSLVKEIFAYGGDVRPYVPEASYEALLATQKRPGTPG